MRLTPRRHHGADAGLPERLVGSEGGLSGLELETAAVIEGVAIGLARRDQHVLPRLGAVRVLDGRVHLLEQAEVVEAALALQHLLLAQRRARLHPHFPAGDSGAGVAQPVEKNSIDKKLLAFMNGEGHANARQVVRRRNRNIGNVDRGIGKTIVEILSQNRVAVIGQTRFVKALSFGGRISGSCSCGSV